MEEKQPSKKSKTLSLTEIDLPSSAPPTPHKPRFLDPSKVAAHFAPLLKNPPTAAERWAKKANSQPFQID